MANNYFQFKQFTIWQDRCAMKVCTDACIFGAVMAERLNSTGPAPAHLLDIGTGTGLLSIMLAQKTGGEIDAVEIDGPAFEQSHQNISLTPWRNRVQAFHEDIQSFRSGKAYDFIFSNPPFFEGDLRSDDAKKNAAKHDTGLTLEQLLAAIIKHLNPGGGFAVLLPYHRLALFTRLAIEAGYFLGEELLVRHTARHPFFRGILFFSDKAGPVVARELSIKNEAGDYSPEIITLLKDYYLHL